MLDLWIAHLTTYGKHKHKLMNTVKLCNYSLFIWTLRRVALDEEQERKGRGHLLLQDSPFWQESGRSSRATPNTELQGTFLSEEIRFYEDLLKERSFGTWLSSCDWVPNNQPLENLGKRTLISENQASIHMHINIKFSSCFSFYYIT